MIKNLFRNKKKGYVLILVALSIPVFLIAINYLITKTQSTHKTNVKTSASHAIGSAILEKYDPAKTFNEQFSNVYTAAMLALNERAFELTKDIIASPNQISLGKVKSLASDTNLVRMYNLFSSYGIKNSIFKKYISSKPLISSDSLLCDKDPLNVTLLEPEKCVVSYEIYSTQDLSSGSSNESIVEFQENKGIMDISFNKSNEYVECDCKYLQKKIRAYPAKCSVDLIIAIPTNHASCTKNNTNSEDIARTTYSYQDPQKNNFLHHTSYTKNNTNSEDMVASNDSYSDTPIAEITYSCQDFLKNNFLHVEGVAVGVIPYSGKISLPPNRSDWTVTIAPMSRAPDRPYMKQIAAYGTDGGGRDGGGFLLESELWGTTEQRRSYNWGNDDPFLLVGFPIMYRRGSAEDWRSLTIYKGDLLLNSDAPNSDAYRFQRMNINPCYLGHCNILSMACEKKSPIYMANPYFITELTDDIQSVIYDLNLIKPINDNHNKSNFLFLPLSWACNLFSDWTNHPSLNNKQGKRNHPVRRAKSQAVIIIVNAPDNFEPKELTYLGFNNDNSEIPMMESDIILFKNGGYKQEKGKYYGAKGAIEYSTTGSTTLSGNGLDYESSSTATVTVLKPGTVRVTAELSLGAPSIEFYNTNGVSQHIGKKNVYGERSFVFLGPQQVYNWNDGNIKFKSGNYTTKGPNFGHNLSLKKLKYKLINAKIKKATLSNQILRYYGRYSAGEMGGKTLIENGSGHCNENKTDETYEKRTDPCIYMEGVMHYNKDDGWTWGTDKNENGSYINAYNFHPTCYGIKDKPTLFIMAATDFPNDSVISVDQLTTHVGVGSNWTSLGIDISPNPGYYRVFNLNYDYSLNDNVCKVFTGRFQYKSQEKYSGSYVSEINYTRSSEKIVKASAINENYVYNEDEGAKVGTSFKCNEWDKDKCTCINVTCTHTWSFEEAQSGWTSGNEKGDNKDHKDYYFEYQGKNCPNSNGFDACTSGRKFKRTGTCDKTYNYTGSQSTSTCGSKDILTLSSSKTTNTEYTINYTADGKFSPTQTPEKYSSYVNWNSSPKKTYTNYRYKLYNFFFKNAGSVEYDPKATKDDILKNKYIGSLDDSLNNVDADKQNNTDMWLCFCGDGQLTLELKSDYKNIKFKDISNSSTTDSPSFENDTIPVLVTNNSSHIVADRRVFYLNTNQLTKKDSNGNYYFKLELEKGIRVVSVELLNFPYEQLTPNVKMYEGDSVKETEDQTVDCAASDTGSTEKKITFKTNKKAAFKVESMVPYAWIDETDFRQRSGDAYIYSNSKDHTFKVRIDVPTSSTEATVSPVNLYNTSEDIYVTSERKLKSFTLSGKYDYVEEETWTKSYISKQNYARSSQTELRAEVYGSDHGRGEGISDEKSGDNGQIKAKIKYSCTADGGCGACKNGKAEAEAVDVIIAADSGWKQQGIGGVFLTEACSEKCTGNDCTQNEPVCVGIAGGINFTRTGTCYKTYNENGNMLKSSCGGKDTLYDTDFETSTHDCIKKYDNERKTKDTCKSTYGSSYIHDDLSKDKKCNDPYSTNIENITQNSWEGSFNSYTYKIENNPKFANLRDIKIKNQVQIYNNGSYANATASCGSNTTSGELKATTSTTYNGKSYYCYSSTATNCQISMSSRTETSGKVGESLIPFTMSTETKSIEISPDQYDFKPDGMGNYIVTIECKNVVVSSPKMEDSSPFIRYAHPNLLEEGIKNVRVLDGNSKITYGAMRNDSTGQEDVLIEHRKYWIIDKNSTNGYTLIDTPEKNFGDFFAIFWDYDNDVPSLSWALNENTDFNGYTKEYSFSGVHRVFFPYISFGDKTATFTSSPYDGKAALLFAGFTMPLNYALYNNGYQTTSGTLNSTLNVSPNDAIKKLSEDACSKLKNLSTGTGNPRIYIVKYRTRESTSLDTCGYKQYNNISSKKDLIKTLHEIAVDIKNFANATDSYVTVEEKNK